MVVCALVLIPLLWSACGRRPIHKTPSRPVETNKPDNRIVIDREKKEDKVDVIISKPDDPFEGRTEQPVETEDTYREYNIGMLLPFNVKLNSLDYSNDSINAKSKLALDFYDGAYMALEDLKNQGMNLNVYVYDTEKSVDKVESILRQPSMKNLDLLVGPVYNKPLKMASEFSKRNKVLMVSPFSPSTSFVKHNPYYFTMESSVETHCAAIYNHVRSVPEYGNVILLHQARNSEMKLADMFKKLDYEAPISADIERVGFRLEQLAFASSDNPSEDYELIKSYLKPNEPNVFIVPSFSERFVNDMLRRLALFKDQYEIIVFGMPNWTKFENINLDYLMDLNVHFTGNFHKDPYLPASQKFMAAYKSKISNEPADNTCKGYDMIQYLAEFIQNRKPNDVFINVNEEEVHGIFSGFEMKPVFNDSTNSINYYENKHLFISKYEDYRIIRVK